MTVQLRPFQTSDTENILTLFYDTVHTVNRNDYSPEQLNAWVPPQPDIKKWRDRFESSKTIVAESDGKLVGFGNLENKKSSIGMLYVHRDFQGQGVGSMLLNKLEGMLEKREVKSARTEASISAQSFFEQKGYQVVKENRKNVNGIDFRNFLMEKKLPLTEKPIHKESKKVKEKSKKNKSFPWGSLFIHKVFDLLIVVAGVSIAFQLNNIKQESDQKRLERFYLESMVVDLDKDLAKTAEVLQDLRSDRGLVNGYLKKLELPNPPVDSLGIIIVHVLEFETFRGNQDTYTTLLTSNGFNTLGDQEVRSQITEYYKQYVSISRFEKVYTDVVYQLNSYFSPYCDYARQQIIDETVVSKVQTKNNLLMASGQLNNGIEDYSEMASKAKALKASIQSALENSRQR